MILQMLCRSDPNLRLQHRMIGCTAIVQPPLNHITMRTVIALPQLREKHCIPVGIRFMTSNECSPVSSETIYSAWLAVSRALRA